MTETPKSRYLESLNSPGFEKDSAQALAVDHLQQLYDALVLAHGRRFGRGGWFSRLFGVNTKSSVKGLYFWGGVGRGKTYLMDLFFETLPFEQKMRTHFHRFMRRVHQELKLVSSHKNPLELVADKIAGEVFVICFDEFFVSDITDAMILANLLDALFKRGVVLVATSNIEPNGLYKDGLQRARFLPAIALLNKHTLVVNVDGGTDYRLRALEKANLYICPLGEAAESALQQCFMDLIRDGLRVRENIVLDIEGRKISAKKEEDDVLWLEFTAICDGPRSQNDYIELAREYHAVIVENVPKMGAHNDDQARRFINLVDEFYDRSVKLVISAEVPLFELYESGRLAFEFQRTVSRLQEMQSQEYLARPHLA